MATAVLFIGWNRPHAGQEEKAYAYLMGEGLEYLKGLEGKYYERRETIALTPHFGSVNGAIILFGERAKLDELRRTDEFEAFSMGLSRLLTGVGVIPGLNWDGIQSVMKRMQS